VQTTRDWQDSDSRGIGRDATSTVVCHHRWRAGCGHQLLGVEIEGNGSVGQSLTAPQDILEVGSIWNAIILIDEADIFMERRTEDNIARNAMVGIFLR
jgi:hypothetical protein